MDRTEVIPRFTEELSLKIPVLSLLPVSKLSPSRDVGTPRAVAE